MKRSTMFNLVAFVGLVASGCPAREQATLCVVSPIPAGAVTDGNWDTQKLGCSASPTGTLDGDLESCNMQVTQDGQSYVLVHRLPEGISPQGKLHLRVQTPCSRTDQDIDGSYVDSMLVLSGVVPPGGRCAFSISAVMANSELGCDFVSTDGSCAAAETNVLCPSE